jgi:hypothetical protein
MLSVLIVWLLTGCAGYVPGRQTYWDAQVKEMCAKDGGVSIFEKIRVTPSEVKLLGHVNGRIAIPVKELANPRSPVYAVNTTSVVREGNPAVWRSEWNIIRRIDGAVLARSVTYNRSGGDIPSPAYESRLTCPAQKTISSDLQRLFIVEGGPQ